MGINHQKTDTAYSRTIKDFSVGTESGLCRYDGYSFKFISIRPGRLFQFGVTIWFLSIYADHTHTLWVGTAGGLNQDLTGSPNDLPVTVMTRKTLWEN